MLGLGRLLLLVLRQGLLLLLCRAAPKRIKVWRRRRCSLVPEIAILAAVGRLHPCRLLHYFVHPSTMQ